MLLRIQRCSRKILLGMAAIPVFQAGTCDATGLSNFVTSQFLGVASSINLAVFQSFIGAGQQALLQAFPSFDILQILLGVNRQPFFP